MRSTTEFQPATDPGELGSVLKRAIVGIRSRGTSSIKRSQPPLFSTADQTLSNSALEPGCGNSPVKTTPFTVLISIGVGPHSPMQSNCFIKDLRSCAGRPMLSSDSIHQPKRSSSKRARPVPVVGSKTWVCTNVSMPAPPTKVLCTIPAGEELKKTGKRSSIAPSSTETLNNSFPTRRLSYEEKTESGCSSAKRSRLPRRATAAPKTLKLRNFFIYLDLSETYLALADSSTMIDRA